MTFGFHVPFYCSECGNGFMRVTAEWRATAFIAPVKCPNAIVGIHAHGVRSLQKSPICVAKEFGK